MPVSGYANETSLKLCVVGIDAANNIQAYSSATIILWTKTAATNSLAAMVDNLPNYVDSNSALSATVSGTGVTHYKYKLGANANVDCGASANYSAEVAIGTSITDDLSSYPLGTKLALCVIGSVGDGVYQARHTAFKYVWFRDNYATVTTDSVGKMIQDINSTQNLNIIMSEAKPYDVTVYFEISGTATDLDYSFNTGQVTIPAGSTTASLSYNILRNSAQNEDKSLVILLTSTSSPAVKSSPLGYQYNMIRDTDSDLGANYSSVTAGGAHICGIAINGQAKCWGANDSGQIGDGSLVTRDKPVLIDSGVTYTQLSAGYYHTCGITTSGVLKCWGRNSYGRLGDGTTTDRTVPTTVDSGITYSHISTGFNHTCGITTAGVLKCWGYNYDGQLGNGTTSTSTTPVIINSGVTYAKVSAGYSHTCGITTTGVLKCWGNNNYGQLGDWSATSRSSPVVIDSGTAYTQVSTSRNSEWSYGLNFTTCGITSTGTLKCWGSNAEGQLGNGTTTQSLGPVTIDAGTIYSQITVGNGFSCGLTATNVVKCSGKNDYSGNLGDGTTTLRLTHVPIDPGVSYTQLVGHEKYSCGITNDGALKCWGNIAYQMASAIAKLTSTANLPSLIDAFTTYSQVATGAYHICGVTTGGILKCWGADSNNYGQLGDGTNLGRKREVIDPGTSYSQISAGNMHSCGITTDHQLKCWGGNWSGQVGDGSTIHRLSPSFVDSGTEYMQVSAGDSHSCGITTTGILKCWGANWSGQIGDGSTTQRNMPVIIDSTSRYIQVSAGNNSTCGVTMTGILKCWGGNDEGQLGDSSIWDHLTPQPVLSDARYTQVSASSWGSHACALTDRGQAHCWGYNGDGQVGDGSGFSRYIPTLIDSATTYTQISAGYRHTCGLTLGGGMKCWGDNSNGGLVPESNQQRLSPTAVDTGTLYSQIQGVTCGITLSGHLRCRGVIPNYNRLVPQPM